MPVPQHVFDPPFNIIRSSHAVLDVTDLDASRAFYETTVGLHVEDRDDKAVFLRGSEELPPHVSGHVGYAVVPWKRRRGYATRALALVLPVARQIGLVRVLVTCDEDNEPSRKVIAANGGVPAGRRVEDGGKRKLLYWVATGT